LLAADAELTGRDQIAAGYRPAAGTGRRRLAAFALALALPAAAVGIYAGIGSPELPGQPLAGRRTAGIEPSVVTRIEAAIVTLNKRIAANPKDFAALDRMGRAYFTLRRYGDAATAFDRARTLRPDIGALSTSYGEALVMAGGGVSPLARAAFADAIKADPNDMRARFYLGVAKSEDDDAKGALAIWLALEAEAQASAQWRARLTRFIEATAKRAGIAPAALAKLRAEAAAAAKRVATGPKAKPGESAPGGIARMNPAERRKLIGRMVARLAARLKENPDDLVGWRRLGRSYLVLGEPDKSVEAYGRAAKLAPRNIAVLVDLGQALLAQHGKDSNLPPRFVKLMRRIGKLDPENAVALWFIGLAEHEAGNAAKATSLWERLLARLPKDSRDRAALAKRIEMLKMKSK
jgi:cytochrome c-type biogenesis protein CcmH